MSDSRGARGLTFRSLPNELWLIAALCVLLDQLTKIWVRRELPLGATQTVLEGWLRWTHSENSGAAWSMLAGQRWLLVLLSVVVTGIVVFMAREFARELPERKLPQLALGMVLGGGVGNLIDRALFGVVTDFIDVLTPLRFLRTFPVFNIADSALTIGVFLLMLHFVLDRGPETGQNALQKTEL